jgi:hypothetical protein
MTKRISASNSFTAREVRAILEMHACVLRGGDAKHIAQSVATCSVVRKFRIMARKYDEAGGATPIAAIGDIAGVIGADVPEVVS